MEVTTIKDLGIKHTTLHAGKYLIDGEGVLLTKNEQVTFKETVQRITESEVVARYEDAEGNTLSVEEYADLLTALTDKGVYEDYSWEFSNLDDEFVYRKFKGKWAPIYRTVEVLSDVTPTKEVEVVLDTGNSFITPLFASGGCPELYEFRRTAAQWDSIKTKFESLGFTYNPDADYKSTGSVKVYGGKGARYVTAFGTYIFSDQITKPTIHRGKLEECLRLYHADRKEVCDRISELYQRHYSSFDKDRLDYKKVLQELESAVNLTRRLDVKKSAISDARALISKLLGLEKLIKSGFVE